MSDTSIKVSIESARLTLNAVHTPDDHEGLRQTLALLQTFLRSVLGESDVVRTRTPRRPRVAAKGEASAS